MKSESEPVDNFSREPEAVYKRDTAQENSKENDVLSSALMIGFVASTFITASTIYVINTLLKGPDTPDSAIQETLNTIDKGYVSEDEMNYLCTKLKKQIEMNKDNKQLILHLGDLYRTHFDYRKAYTQYKIVAQSKKADERVIAQASLNGLLLDALPKSLRKTEELKPLTPEECEKDRENEAPECTKITFSTFCADETNKSIMKNCFYYRNTSKEAVGISNVSSTSDK